MREEKQKAVVKEKKFFRGVPLERFQKQLTERDAEVLHFIHDMKFASVREIHPKFFGKTYAGIDSKSNEWARERLRQLQKVGLLNKAHSFCDSTLYYTGTNESYRTLVGEFYREDVIKPLKRIQLQTFRHDRLVLRERLKLEKEFGDVKWISDRRLRCGAAEQFSFSKDKIPDAVYTLPCGTRVALEIELSTKSAWARSQIINHYHYHFRNTPRDKYVDKIRYLFSSKANLAAFNKSMQFYSSWYQLELLSKEDLEI